jgi:hypothetical protein
MSVPSVDKGVPSQRQSSATETHRRIHTVIRATVFAATLLSATVGFGQSFQESCAGADLNSGDSLDISETAVSGGDRDFTLPASCDLGNTPFSDIVVCFTPQNSCTVDFTCTATGGSDVRASIVQGPCSTNPVTCLVAGANVVPANPSTAAWALVSGQNYCFICQNTIGNGSFNASISATVGDCGALPAELLKYRIE